MGVRQESRLGKLQHVKQCATSLQTGLTINLARKRQIHGPDIYFAPEEYKVNHTSKRQAYPPPLIKPPPSSHYDWFVLAPT